MATFVEEMAAFYDRVSGTYDQAGHPIFADFGREAIERLDPEPGARILDLATGRGALLLPAAHRVGAQGVVIGIDISPQMIERLQAELVSRGLGRAQAQVMDAGSLPFPDGSFDCVTCGFALFFFPDVLAALREARRVLRPEGRILVATWLGDPDSTFAGGGWYWELVGRYLPPRPAPAFDFGSAAGMARILEEAGFRHPGCATVERTYAYPDEEAWWAEQHTHGGRRPIELIPEARLAEFKAQVFAGLGRYREGSGLRQRVPVLFSMARK